MAAHGTDNARACPWQDLWDFAAAVAAEASADPASVLDPIGLLLRHPSGPAWDAYDTTPRNAETFAGTGGDGVHFSIVRTASGMSPVVMTVPMNWDNANLIVGQDVHEFLALGCQSGYFVLEQLSYSPVDTVRSIESGHLESAPGADRILTQLRLSFDLRPWASVRSRLDALGEQFRADLDLP